MSLKNFLVKAGLVEDTEKPEQPIQTTKPAILQPVIHQFPTSLNQSIIVELQKSIADSPTTKPYADFSSALSAQASIIPDETARLKSVLATMTAMGSSIPNIMKGASACLAVLDQEEAEFQQTIQQLTQSKVVDANKTLDGLTAQVQSLTTDIEQKKQQIGEILRQHGDLRQQTTQEEDKIQKLANDFTTALATVKAEVDEHVAKLQIYKK